MCGRQIHQNLRETIDIISHINCTGKKAVVISIDFEKCFDRSEHQSIYAVLKYFGFGSNFIKWWAIFFTKFVLHTQNNGSLSESFLKGRGVNQGCPISPFYFNMCGEVMAHLIKNNPKIKGITLSDITKGETEYVISQFADDTNLFSTFSEECLNETI